MAFVKIPGIKGKIYEPDNRSDSKKKHDCQDCYSCQMCSDTRCDVCRPEQPIQKRYSHKKLTNNK